MASAFGHVAVAYALGKTSESMAWGGRFWLLSVGCCLLPDLDVVGLFLGIPYEHVLGHRGITHSFPFAFVIGLLVAKYAVPSEVISRVAFWKITLYFFLVTASHGLLDAVTDGGLGIAFFAPFDGTRYFLPWRPLEVAPIGVSQFFSSWGLKVLISESIWIGIPVGLWVWGGFFVGRWKKAAHPRT